MLAIWHKCGSITHRRKAHSHTLTAVFDFSCTALSQGHCNPPHPLTAPPNPLQHLQKWPCFQESTADLTSLAVGPVFTAAECRANAARRSGCHSSPPGCGGGASGVGTPTAEMNWLTARQTDVELSAQRAQIACLRAHASRKKQKSAARGNSLLLSLLCGSTTFMSALVTAATL